MKKYKLCYIDGNKAWFTNDFEHCWGDDFDDRPYEHNADPPYDHWYDDEGNEHSIELKALYFETNDWSEKQPCDIGRFSVEDINNQAVAWLQTDKYNILAGTPIKDFIDIVERYGGVIYLKKEN